MTRNPAIVERAKALLEFERQHGCLEGDDETIFWHVLANLIEWCDAQSPRVDFDAVLSDVRDSLRFEYDGPRRT